MSVIVSEPTVSEQYEFVIGVDTHAATHTFALVTAATGAFHAHAEFPTSPAGLSRAQSWLQQRTGELDQLFRNASMARQKLADDAKRLVVAQNSCIRNALGDPTVGASFSKGFSPTAENYRSFALTPDGLAIGFAIGQVGFPPCGSVSVVVPYDDIRPYLSVLGRSLVAGVRPPTISSSAR